jgi:hypothetical protein
MMNVSPPPANSEYTGNGGKNKKKPPDKILDIYRHLIVFKA